MRGEPGAEIHQHRVLETTGMQRHPPHDHMDLMLHIDPQRALLLTFIHRLRRPELQRRLVTVGGAGELDD